ncbi:MAG: hypothetical protein ACP5U1_04610 [Desulfomonilaceae bacterium]
MNQQKPEKDEASANSKQAPSVEKPDDLEKLTSIEQIDDSELPQSLKDKFKN